MPQEVRQRVQTRVRGIRGSKTREQRSLPAFRNTYVSTHQARERQGREMGGDGHERGPGAACGLLGAERVSVDEAGESKEEGRP